jgi:hypothetical protein
MKAEFVLLLGVEDDLFKTCFGDDSAWSCPLRSLPEDCSRSELTALLQHPGLGCVVIQDDDEGPHWDDVVEYYRNGGFVVYFGIYGEFAAPGKLSRAFDLDWSFSAYTRHEYELTPVGKEILGDVVTDQPYSKANLLKVPEADRVLVPKHSYATVQEFMDNECDSDDDEVRGRALYEEHRAHLHEQVPLALHRSSSTGGRIAYLGFVNGDGNIPLFVRALCTGEKISSS